MATPESKVKEMNSLMFKHSVSETMGGSNDPEHGASFVTTWLWQFVIYTWIYPYEITRSMGEHIAATKKIHEEKLRVHARIEGEGKDQDPAQEAQRLVLPASIDGDGSARDT